jgi:dTMP kinase
MLPVYKKIVSELKKLDCEVPSEHVVDPKTTDGDWEKQYDPEKLYKRETDKIDTCEALVAEVTVPSWGTAFMMEHALNRGIPVLALYYEENEQPLPLMLAGHPELYVEHYDTTNIHTVLKKSLEHFVQMKARKGKLVIIDGANGSGKSTQVNLLLEYLKKNEVKHDYISFPRYHTSFHGKHVGRFLAGEFGGNEQVSPYLSSLAFALDRLTARDEIVEWLESGDVVVADRYVSASMAHQGSKLQAKEQKEFLNWVYTMEYKEHRLPKEDVVLYLYIPADISHALLAKSGRKLDMEDKDIEHNRKSIAMYQELSKKYKHWVMVECVDEEGKLMSIEAIHEKILGILKERKII